MHNCATTLISVLLLIACGGLGRAQSEPPPEADARVRAAIAALDDASPSVRAQARSDLLRIGEPALAALRSALQAQDDLPPELLLVRAEQVGAERRSRAFELDVDRARHGWCIAWRGDGAVLAVLEEYGSPLRLLDGELEPGDEPVGGVFTSVAFGTGGVLALAERQSNQALVRHPDGHIVRMVTGQDGGVTFSPDGTLLATGGYGLVVRVLRTEDGRLHRRFTVGGVLGGLTPVFSPDGKTLAVGNRNDRTTLIDVESGELLHELPRRQTQGLSFSPDGRRLAIAYVDGRIGIWNVARGDLEKLLASGCEEAFTVAWSPDGSLLATAGLAGPIEVWSARHLARLHALDPGSERTFDVDFRPDGAMLVSVGNGRLRSWRISGPK